MRTLLRTLLTLVLLVLSFSVASPLAAQLPQGWYVFGTYGRSGQTGLFMSHPRTAGKPTTITGLRGDLIVTGSSCTLYRPNDDTILCGERAQVNSSVDLHVITLKGAAVLHDASFSVGTGGSCCGEIPQMGLLPDGRVVLAATDVAAGPLSLYKTTRYGYQGLGIVDTTSGSVTAIPITNGAKIVDVFNGLAIAPDNKSVYVGTYVSATQGDIYQVPLPKGGFATLVASVPAGLSNLAFDNDGLLWVTTLDASQGLFRVDFARGTVDNVPQTNGALNAMFNESVTGNFAVVSGSRGSPTRSIFWMEPSGKDHLLASPGLATPSGIAIHLNPSRFGTGTTTASNTYDWLLAPNPGGLPQVGNSKFSLTVAQSGKIPAVSTVFAIGVSRLDTPVPLLGADVWVDLTRPVILVFRGGGLTHTLALPVPNKPAFVGIKLFVQTMHQEFDGPIGASSGVSFTVL